MSSSKVVINTRADLDALEGTEAHKEFMEKLKGSMTRKQDIQTYPENYNQPDYAGDKLEPIWDDVEDLTTIEAFGFKKSDFK